MNRCSPYVWIGVALQILVLLGVLGGYWWVREYIPTEPIRNTEKMRGITPQSIYFARLLIIAVSGTTLAAVACLVGLVHGPRNRRCFLCSAPSILVVGLPLV